MCVLRVLRALREIAPRGPRVERRVAGVGLGRRRRALGPAEAHVAAHKEGAYEPHPANPKRKLPHHPLTVPRSSWTARAREPRARLDGWSFPCDTRAVQEMVELLVSFAVTTSALFAIVVYDERRLSPEACARAWPRTSRDAALVVFGVLALPVHFARTRRSVGGLLLGLLLSVAVSALNVLVLGTLEWFVHPN